MTVDHEPFESFLASNDFAPNTIRAMRLDFAKFVRWFEAANAETYRDDRVTTRDLADYRRHLREDRRQAVATCNRNVISLRTYLSWLADQGVIQSNPGRGIKELRRVVGAPKAIERSKVRKMLREATVRMIIADWRS